jgi:cobalt-zinc-cadmium efflux system membrane fusion protein
LKSFNELLKKEIKMNSKIFIAIVIIGAVFSCKNNVSNTKHNEHDEHGPEDIVMLTNQQQEALNLRLGTFRKRNLTTTVKTNGQLQVPPVANACVTGVIGGNVKKIKVFHGDKVRKGQALVVLEHRDYIDLQEKFAETARQLEFLELEFKRQKELYENNVGAGRDFQKVKSEYNIAKAKYEGLKARLRLLNLSPEKVKNGIISNSVTITAPIGGYVSNVNIKTGSYVDAKDELLEITDNSQIHADFMVFEKDMHLLKIGQRVHFTVSNSASEELTATVFAIGKEFETSTRAVHIHARLDNDPGNLIPGMYISGHIHTDEINTRALPDDAIVKEGTKSYIFVLDESAEQEGYGAHDGHKDHKYTEETGDVRESHEKEAHKLAFRMVEIIAGQQDGGYTEVKLLDSIPRSTPIVMNAAYYLLADLKKGEAEHHH